MQNIRFYIDQRHSEHHVWFRLRVVDRIGNKRVEIKAIYCETREEAERFKKHFRELFNYLTTKPASSGW